MVEEKSYLSHYMETLKVSDKVRVERRKKLVDILKQVAQTANDGANAKKGHKGFVKVSEHKQKSKVVSFNVTPSEKELIQEASDIMGVSSSTLIRRALRAFFMPEIIAETKIVDEKQGELFED